MRRARGSLGLLALHLVDVYKTSSLGSKPKDSESHEALRKAYEKTLSEVPVNVVLYFERDFEAGPCVTVPEELKVAPWLV